MSRSARAENAIQVMVLLAVGGMAGAASFTHMHDWTMDNVPAGTGDWFGWGNAVISELTPVVAGLEVRRRRRNGEPAGLPTAVMVGFAALSMAAQFAQAKPGFSGWLLAGLPAVAFMILIKLVLSRTPVRAEVPAEVWTPVQAEATVKLPAPKAEVPALPERKPEAEAPQVNAQFPPLPMRKPLPEISAPVVRKPARKPEAELPPLVVAKRSPETTWQAAQALMLAQPELSFKAVAERVGVSDRRLRQIRTEMTQTVSA